MNRLTAVHDASSRWLFVVAASALLVIVGLYVFEVVMRYAFTSPTTWSGETVQYALAVLLFCGLPEVTRQGAHVAIDVVSGSLPPSFAGPVERINAMLGAAVCAVTGWIIAGEASRQFARGLLTNAANPIPRWWITAIIALGFASAALHFLRLAFAREK